MMLPNSEQFQSDTSLEKALDERLRQAEVRITAQATYLAAIYHRAAVLLGVVFAISAALFSATVADWLRPMPDLLVQASALLSLIPLVALIFATALAKASLPGAIDAVASETATAMELKEALIASYRQAAEHNERRLSSARRSFLTVPFAVAIVAALTGVAIYEDYTFLKFRYDNSRVTKVMWDDVGWVVQRRFSMLVPGAADADQEHLWNMLNFEQQRAVFSNSPCIVITPSSDDDASMAVFSEDGGYMVYMSRSETAQAVKDWKKPEPAGTAPRRTPSNVISDGGGASRIIGCENRGEATGANIGRGNTGAGD